MSESYFLLHEIKVTKKIAGGEPREEITPAGAEVVVRRPKGRDLRVIDRHPGQIAQTLALIEAITDLAGPQVEELDGEDVTGLGEIVGRFFPDIQETGKTS